MGAERDQAVVFTYVRYRACLFFDSHVLAIG